MYAHYADIKIINNNKVTIVDRNNNLDDDSEITINIDEDEKEYIKKCKWVRLEFLKKPPEEDVMDKKGKGKITINIDMDQIKLPNYKYTLDEWMDSENISFEEACKELHLDPKETTIDDGDIVKEVPVPKKDIKRFKKELMTRIRDDIELIMGMYEDGEIEQPNLDETIDD